MATFRFHARVPATPDAVWEVLSDVDTIPEWFPGIENAVFDGRYRILSLTGGGTLRARVVTNDPALRRFQYSFVDGMPQPIEFHLGTLDVIEDGTGALVVYSQQIEPDELGAIVGPAVAGGIEGIRRYFHGRPASETAEMSGVSEAAAIRRIATEESFAIPEISAATREFMTLDGARTEPGLAALTSGFGAEEGRRWMTEALDFGSVRDDAMLQAGIDTQILLLSAPGVQIFPPDQAAELARLANDRVAAVQRAAPHRFAGLATVAPQDPAVAAAELERAVGLGLRGALINSHTGGEYLDDRKFWPVLEAAQALDVPIYLHPREPSPAMLEPFRDHALFGPIWGFAAEAGLHALRLIMAGVFDEFPRLRIILGHLGEGLPFFIDRIDIRYAVDGSPLRRRLELRPGDYLRRNFVLTTSGMNWEPSVRQSITVMGAESVMFAADWPFENATTASRAFDRIALSEPERHLLLHTNAERVFRL